MEQRWFFQGMCLSKGSRILIDGVEWQVLGAGRSRNETQTFFLWIWNEASGITVYMPSAAEAPQRLTAA